jgi:hypothetical protein
MLQFPKPLLPSSTLKAGAAALVLLVGTLGCGKGAKTVPGLEGFQAGVLKSHLYVSFTSTSLHWDQGLTVPIPGLDDSTISVAPDLTSSGAVFQFSIGVDALIKQGKALPHSGLPDGTPLPDVTGGTLPRWDTQIKGLKLSLYLSDDAFGLFVPLSFISQKGVSLPYQVSVSIQDERGNTLGKVFALPGESGSGLFVLLPYLGAEPHLSGA